jgi:5-methylcytosine-specific restriction protein A
MKQYNTFSRDQTKQKLYNTTQWKKLRRTVLRAQPVCTACGAKLATDVDHIQPHDGDTDLFYDITNLQPLCHECHSRKTMKEQRQVKG